MMNEKSEDEYSDNFEEDVNEDRELSEESYDDEIRVYKSLTGPSLTIQPCRPKKKVPFPSIKTESDGNLLAKKGPKIALPTRKSTRSHNLSKAAETQTSSISIPSKKDRSQRTNRASNSSAEKALISARRLPPKRTVKYQPRPTASHSKSVVKLYPLNNNHYMSTQSLGSRKMIGSTNNISNRIARDKRLVVTPYCLPPMRLGPAKSGNVAQRVASAKRMTINDLKNRISQLMNELEDIKKENRALTHIQNRQHTALKKWEGRECELPLLLQRHSDELRTSQDQLRKSTNHVRELNEKLTLKDRKIARMDLELQRLKLLAEKENLHERSELQQNLEIVSANLSGAEQRIRQYMRHVEILNKNHQHQIAAEQQKLIRANNHALDLRQEITQLKLALREKDRMLNYIQMRSTGRILVKSFQEQERARTSKYTAPLSLSNLNSHRSDSDQSISPRRPHHICGESFSVANTHGDFVEESQVPPVTGKPMQRNTKKETFASGDSKEENSSAKEKSVLRKKPSSLEETRNQANQAAMNKSVQKKPTKESFVQTNSVQKARDQANQAFKEKSKRTAQAKSKRDANENHLQQDSPENNCESNQTLNYNQNIPSARSSVKSIPVQERVNCAKYNMPLSMSNLNSHRSGRGDSPRSPHFGGESFSLANSHGDSLEEDLDQIAKDKFIQRQTKRESCAHINSFEGNLEEAEFDKSAVQRNPYDNFLEQENYISLQQNNTDELRHQNQSGRHMTQYSSREDLPDLPYDLSFFSKLGTW